MPTHQTEGTHYNVKCPYCDGNNHYVTQGIKIELGKVAQFQKPCQYCGGRIYYHAKYEIMVTAYRNDPTKS